MLSTPPAFILSQDQTLMFKFVLGHSKAWLFYNRFTVVYKVFTITRKAIAFLFLDLSRLFHCSVIKVVCCSRFKRQLLYLTKVICFCQELFLFIFYCHLTSIYVMGLSGLEPPTSRLSGVRSNRLSYKPISISQSFATACL